jgi:hypothetical protein
MGLEQQLHSLIQKLWVTKQRPLEQADILKPQQAEGPWPVFYDPIDEDALFLSRYAAFIAEQVPEDPEATRFIQRFARECCLTRTSLINAYIYFTKTRNTLLYTWRMLFVNCLLISERMWMDNYIHPAFIRQRYTLQPCANKFTSIQLEILTALDWKINTSEAEYNQIHELVFSRSERVQDRARLPERPLPALPKINFEGYRRKSSTSTTGSVSSFLHHAL